MANDSPLSDAQAKRLIKMYDEAETEILREVNRLLLKDPESYSLAWQKTILARVQQIRAGLLSGSRKWCEEAISKSYMEGVSWADKDPLSGKELMGGFGGIHQQAVEVLSENSYNRLADVNGVIGRRTDDIFREVALTNIKGSVIGYQTTRQAARRIREDLASRGITGFVDKAGRSWNMSRYARVVAQETTNQAFRAGTINRLQQKGHDLVRCSGHSGACKKCQQWEGKTLSMSGGDAEYPSVDEARANGLFHVGCLHVLSLAPEERDKAIARLKGPARNAEIKRLAEKGGWKGTKKSSKEAKLSGVQKKEQPPEPKAAGPAAGKVFIPAKTTK